MKSPAIKRGGGGSQGEVTLRSYLPLNAGNTPTKAGEMGGGVGESYSFAPIIIKMQSSGLVINTEIKREGGSGT